LKYYEIIYETGNHSVAAYEDDAEAISAISEHHRRAKSGEKAQQTNPDMGPAERIAKVLKYDEHPINFNESQVATKEDITAAVDSAISEHGVGDLVSVQQVAASVRDISSPVVDSGPHESNYKMAETGELDASKWDGDNNKAGTP